LASSVTGAAGAALNGRAVDIRELSFGYVRGKPVLDVPSLTVTRGERVFLFGPSGSGKTTLLGLLAGVLKPDSGSVQVLGVNLETLSGPERDEFRAVHIGYIFQMFNLIPYLSVLDNIVLPCRLSSQRRARLGGVGLHSAGEEMARQLGIGGLIHDKVTELSVGQQQRVAAARALLGHPELVVADEPTSALDTDLRESFLELLFRSCELAGATLIFVSHDRQLMPLFTSSISLPEINRLSQSLSPDKSNTTRTVKGHTPLAPAPRK
jgi:putative ABC transport system ATP-binding protein